LEAGGGGHRGTGGGREAAVVQPQSHAGGCLRHVCIATVGCTMTTLGMGTARGYSWAAFSRNLLAPFAP
jgi:hypothetical protein